MAAPTKQEMLDAVEEAMQAILTGGAVKSYKIGDRELERMSLPELTALRNQLRAEIGNESGNGTQYGSFKRPQ